MVCLLSEMLMLGLWRSSGPTERVRAQQGSLPGSRPIEKGSGAVVPETPYLRLLCRMLQLEPAKIAEWFSPRRFGISYYVNIISYSVLAVVSSTTAACPAWDGFVAKLNLWAPVEPVEPGCTTPCGSEHAGRGRPRRNWWSHTHPMQCDGCALHNANLDGAILPG